MSIQGNTNRFISSIIIAGLLATVLVLVAVGWAGPAYAQDTGQLTINSNLPTIEGCASGLKYVVTYREDLGNGNRGSRHVARISITGTSWPSAITVDGVKQATDFHVSTKARCRGAERGRQPLVSPSHDHGVIRSSGTPEEETPSAPVTVEVNGSDVTVSWRTSDSCSLGYQVLQRRVNQNTGWNVVDIDSTQTSSHTLTALASGKHVIRVKCVERERGDRKIGPYIGRAVAIVQ